MNNNKLINYGKIIIPVLILIIVLISGCSQAGISKAARLEIFITKMESGDTANPRNSFAGHPNAYLVTNDVFINTNMDPGDDLDITGYVINGDSFTMTYWTTTYGTETIDTASFHMVTGSLGGEEWFIKSMTVPVGLSDTTIIPDNLIP